MVICGGWLNNRLRFLNASSSRYITVSIPLVIIGKEFHFIFAIQPQVVKRGTAHKFTTYFPLGAVSDN